MVTKPNGDDGRYIDGTINNVGKNVDMLKMMIMIMQLMVIHA